MIFVNTKCYIMYHIVYVLIVAVNTIINTIIPVYLYNKDMWFIITVANGKQYQPAEIHFK